MDTSGLPRFAYRKGLCDLGRSAWAWLQPDGGWGWSNAGLISAGGETLLVDTLFDLKLTDEMLAAMRRAVPAAANIGQLVNTHGNGDHWFGNSLVAGARIVASRAAAEEMAAVGPERLRGLLATARAQSEHPVGRVLLSCFAPFDFTDVPVALPDRTFSGELELRVGDKQVRLIEVGPAHTQGDIVVWVPEDRLLFSGDVLFVDGTPIMWAGPVANWIAACDRILKLPVDIIVPGHGPITDQRGPRAVKAYLEYITAEARRRFDAGLSAEEAGADIALGDFSSWGDAERIAVNVDTLYREFRGSNERTGAAELFARMAKLARR